MFPNVPRVPITVYQFWQTFQKSWWQSIIVVYVLNAWELVYQCWQTFQEPWWQSIIVIYITLELVYQCLQSYQNHLDSLKLLLVDSSRQTDIVQPIAHRLRMTITVASTLQQLDGMVKAVKSREYRLYSQKLPLMIERWIKAQNNMRKYDDCVSGITQAVQG